uniref:DNA-directed DNA polymerase family A palm domain-containing protein n=1 Tax=Ciona savignyi TaxID=51511 RepID=H2Z451_CIOSA
MGAQTLAQQMHTTEALAQQTMDSFLRSYPKIKLYFNKLIAKCKEKGYIETISGRRRKLPEINSSRLKLRSHAERQAINSTIQGSAADIVKTATCHINSALHDMGWNTVLSCNRTTKASCYLTHHIHDELIYQTSEHRVHEAARVIQHCMVNAWS